MIEQMVLSLSSDRPVQSLKDDKLGRGDFVIGLANAFVTWKGTDSLVAALYGPWGSGKTSVKNMVLDVVRKSGSPPTVVEFNPWAWSGQDRLLGAFLHEIGTAVAHKADGEQAKELAGKWKRYAARLGMGEVVLGHLKTATTVMGVPYVPFVIDAASEAAKKARELSENAAEAHSKIAATYDDEDTESLKKSLAESLAKIETPIVVVMDDVDRLTEQEIRLLFQLIKANADFPKMVYLLLFDRAVVETALNGITGTTGREYMEKIIQAGFDVPKVQPDTVEKVLFEGLNAILNVEGMNRTFSQEHWASVYVEGLRPLFQTLRDVKRFISSFSFSVLLFYREKTLEVNPIDLIALEALRLFEPDIYHALPHRKSLLLGESHTPSSGRNETEERKARLSDLLQSASDEHREVVRQLLGVLFPEIGWLLRGYGRGTGFEGEWLRHLRVCHPQLFDRYFLLTVPEGDIPQSLMDAVIAATTNRASILGLLQRLQADGRLMNVLRRLPVYSAELDPSRRTNLITSVYDVGDALPESGRGLLDLGAEWTASAVAYHLLMQENDDQKRTHIFLDAIASTVGLTLPLRQTATEEGRHEKEDGSDMLTDADGLTRAKELCVEKLRAAAKTSTLSDKNLSAHLWDWRRWGGEEEPRRYAECLASTPEGALRFLRGFASEVRSQPMDGYVTHSRWRVSLKSMEPFVNIDKLRDILAPFFDGQAPPGSESLLTSFGPQLRAFQVALRRRDEGKPDDAFDAGVE